jgi:hypothetical protein
MGIKKIISESLLVEGRKEDAWSKYIISLSDGKLRDELIDSFNYFVSNDVSGNHKYLDWMMKNMKSLLESGNRSVKNQDMVDYITKFHQNIQRLDKKDINQYRGIHELSSVLNSLTTSRRVEKLEGAEKIFEDQNLMVVVPLNSTGSCKYGSETRWCVSAREDNQFNNYRRDGILFFIVWKLKMPQHLKEYQKIARYIPHGYAYETEGEYFTSTDRSIGGSVLERNLFGRVTRYNNNLGVVVTDVPENSRGVYSSWESAKIVIDTYYAKNGMNVKNSRELRDDFWGDDDDFDQDFDDDFDLDEF